MVVTGFGVAAIWLSLTAATSHGQAQEVPATAGHCIPALDEFLSPETRFQLPPSLVNAPLEDPEEADDEFEVDDSSEAARQEATKVPKIKKVQPKRVAAAGPEFRLRVNGENFKNGAQVLLNGTAVPTVFRNRRSIFAQVPTSLTAAVGTISVVAKNPDGSTTQPASFEVVNGLDGLEITALQPAIVLESTPDFVLKIAGTGFRDKIEARVAGIKTAQLVRRRDPDGLVLLLVRSRDVAKAGSVPIQVQNKNGLSKVFNLLIAPPPPRIESTDPIRLELNATDTKVKIRGRNFTNKARVVASGTVIPSEFISDTRIDATFPAAFLKETRQLEVAVEIPEEGISDFALLPVAATDPLIFGISPTRIVAGEPDFQVNITGINLTKQKKKTRVLVNGESVKFEDTSGRELRIQIKKELVESPGSITIMVTVDDVTANTATLLVEPATTTSTMAGDTPGFRDGVTTKAWFTRPSRAALGPDGKIYIADQLNHAIRQFDPSSGQVTTIAGDGIQGYVDTADIDTTDKNDDNDRVRFNNPLGVAVDAAGIIYVSDFGNDVIRRIRRTDSQVTVDTFAGENILSKNEDTGFKERVGRFGFINGNGNEARFSGPDGIILAPDGKFYVADAFNNVIRVITPQGDDVQQPVVSAVFGLASPGIVDGEGIGIRFNRPTSVALKGNLLYVADFGNNRIRVVDLTGPSVTTLTGVVGEGNNDGPRFTAKLNGPLGLTLIGDKVFVVDNFSNRVRRVEPNGEISTVAGKIEEFADGLGPKARFRQPRDLMTIGQSIFVVDQGNHRLRQVQ